MSDKALLYRATQKLDFKKDLGRYQTKINSALEEYFNELPAKLDIDLSANSQGAIDKLREYSLRPSKRIRGYLAAVSYDCAKDTELSPSGIQLAIALELIQSYLLIVDDVMDKSDLRRGRPTVHQLYLKESGDSHESNMLAVNVGLIAQHLANQIILNIKENSANINETLKFLHKNVMITGFGQIDDLYQKIGNSVSRSDIIRKYYQKSSYYTFINPLQCGQALAKRVNVTFLSETKAFGILAGMAFQLHDDYLDVFGESQSTGKASAGDIKEGKYTLLVQYALEHAGSDDKEALSQRLGDQDISQKQIVEVRTILERSGAKQFVVGETQSCAKLAKGYLSESVAISSDLKIRLSKLIDYSVSRQV